MSINRDSSYSAISAGDFPRYDPLNLQFENRVIVTSNTTFVVPANTKALKFTAVGGGGAGAAQTGGAGGGYFEKSFYAPFTGLTTSFQLTIGAAGGNTVLANSAGTTIATAYGATAIGAGATVGVGGTATGGDINSQGSPGGTSPGVGGASGCMFGAGQYNSTYAGRWLYFKESLVNTNILNYLLVRGNFNNIGVSGTSGATGSPGGFGGNGGPSSGPASTGGAGGFGGNGGSSTGPAGGLGGSSGFGGESYSRCRRPCLLFIEGRSRRWLGKI